MSIREVLRPGHVRPKELDIGIRPVEVRRSGVDDGGGPADGHGRTIDGHLVKRNGPVRLAGHVGVTVSKIEQNQSGRYRQQMGGWGKLISKKKKDIKKYSKTDMGEIGHWTYAISPWYRELSSRPSVS